MNNSKSNVFEKNHIVIVRTAGSFLNIDSYNCQEIGLAKALVKKGWNVSVILAGKKKTKRTVYSDCNQINVYYVSSRSINEALTCFTDFFPLLASLKPTHLQIHEFGMWMSYRVVRWAKKNNIPVVFHIELSNGKVASTIAEETNAKVLEFHTAHNISKKDFDNEVTFIDLLKKDIKVLKEALN